MRSISAEVEEDTGEKKLLAHWPLLRVAIGDRASIGMHDFLVDRALVNFTFFGLEEEGRSEPAKKLGLNKLADS